MTKRTAFLVMLLALSIILCGCKDGNENEGGSTAGGEPVYGGSIVVGITQDLDGLDPHKVTSAGTREILFNVFEGLVKSDKDGNLVPAVASSYTVSADAKEYTFVLREGIKFQNGTLVTAEDVIYSIKRCAGLLETSDPEVVVQSALSVISDVKEGTGDNGETTIIVSLKESSTEIICYLTCAIIPKDYVSSDGIIPGTGPFMVQKYTPLQSLVIVKNENYYVPGVPYLDEVTFKISTDTDAAFMELLAGGIDIFSNLTADQAAQLGQSFNIEAGGANLVQALFVNAAVEPFNDIRVRQALCYAIDRQYIIDMVGDGNGTVVESGIYPSFGKYYNESLASYYTRDTEKAKELLTEAGYPNGFTFTITVPSNYDFHVGTAEVIAEQLKAVGITVKIQLVEWATWYSDVYKGEQYEGTIIGLDANLAPSDVLRFYPSTSSKNFMNYSSAEFDEIFAKAIVETDDAKKIDYYMELQRLLTEDAAAVYIQCPAILVAVNKNLSGYTFYPVFVQDMSTLYYTAE